MDGVVHIPSLKPPDQQEQIRTILRKHRIERLYHFTDARNWTLIQSSGGLFSRSECKRLGMTIPCPGGNVLSARRDANIGHDEYIHLCFHFDQPMKFRRQQNGDVGQCVILAVDLEVTLWRDTKFSDINASDANARIGDDVEALRGIDLSVAMEGYFKLSQRFQPVYESTKKRLQAEVLVRHHIPLGLIKMIGDESKPPNLSQRRRTRPG